MKQDLAYNTKIVPVEDAIAIVRQGDTVATSGFVGVGTPDGVISALERRFLDTGTPRDLTLVFAAAPGDGKDKGLNRLAHEGLVRRLVGGHFGLVPKLARMATEGTVEAYNLPLGCVSQLFGRSLEQSGTSSSRSDFGHSSILVRAAASLSIANDRGPG